MPPTTMALDGGVSYLSPPPHYLGMATPTPDAPSCLKPLHSPTPHPHPTTASPPPSTTCHTQTHNSHWRCPQATCNPWDLSRLKPSSFEAPTPPQPPQHTHARSCTHIELPAGHVQPLGPQPRAGRVLRRQRSRCGRQPVRRRAGQRHRRQHPAARALLRGGGPQADVRPRVALRPRVLCVLLGLHWTAGPLGCGCCRVADGHGRWGWGVG